MRIFPYRNRLTFIISSLTLSSSALCQVVVDNFDPVNHAHDFTFGSSEYVNRSFVRVFNGPMLGVERDVEYFQEVPTNAAGRPEFYTKYQPYFSSGQEYFSIGAVGPGGSLGRARGYIEMQYDRNGDEVGNTGFDRHLRNVGTGQPFFVGDHYGLRLTTRSRGSDVIQTTISLRSQGVIIASVGGTIGGSSAAWRNEDFLLPLEAMRQTDSITFHFDLDAGGFSDQIVFIDQIETIVPEPSTLALFGLSGLYLMSRARRQR